MSPLKSLAFVFVFCLSLGAQQPQPKQRHPGADEWANDTVPEVMTYCDAADHFSAQEQPRIFARLKSKLDEEWAEFAGEHDWQAAGKPAPLVFAWDRNGATVKVTVIANLPRARRPFGAYRRTEYCYGPDARLIRVRAVSYVPTRCEFLFPCQLIGGHEFFLNQSVGTTDWVFTSDGQIQKLWNGKAREDYFDPSYSLTVNDLHLKSSDELPFHHLISPE